MHVESQGRKAFAPESLAVIVADTDVLIDALHGRDTDDRVAAALAAGSLATTTISAFELESGARSAAARQAVRAGICLVRGAALMTRNRAPFDRVTGLELISSAPRFPAPHQPLPGR